MKPLPVLLSRIILFSMILIAPAMMAGNTKGANFGPATSFTPVNLPYYSSVVIKKFMTIRPAAVPVYSEDAVDHTAIVSRSASESVAAGLAVSAGGTVSVAAGVSAVAGASTAANISGTNVSAGSAAVVASSAASSSSVAARLKAAAASLELKLVLHEATSLYDSMNLVYTGLSEEAFEYAWRGFHNLKKKGLLSRTSVLSICDFSQSSSKKRMYIIDVRRKKLLFNTYVAHGMNSGTEYANSFSNIPESGKSSLGFYVTGKTYYGRNGLSLKIFGVDRGYNDLAGRRNIVLHGCNYISNTYLNTCGEMGTSLGCPAIPAQVSPRIIRAVKNGSCLFIFHPTRKYLEESKVLHG